MTTNIIIQYIDGVYSEIRKIFDENENYEFGDSNHYFVTFLFDIKHINEKVDIANFYLKGNNHHQFLAFNMTFGKEYDDSKQQELYILPKEIEYPSGYKIQCFNFSDKKFEYKKENDIYIQSIYNLL